MATDQHRVCGFFVKLEAATGARRELIRRGIAMKQLSLFANEQAGQKWDVTELRSDAPKIALLPASITLFVASPLIAPLSIIGWGAWPGAVAGSTHISKDGGMLSDLLANAIQSGQVVLIATTHSENEASIAMEVMQAAVGGYKAEP